MAILELDDQFVLHMVCRAAPSLKDVILSSKLYLRSSDSYGKKFERRTWCFVVGDNLAAGAIERYSSGLKMICSVADRQSHTYFFKEDGSRTSCKSLWKGLHPEATEEKEVEVDGN